MSLTSLSPLAFAAGLGALAGLLFALQRLRVRHRERVVVTTLFWREALERTRARELFERFRHPLAYLLALLVAGLLWFGVAGPRLERRGERDWVVLVDGSAAMAPEGRLASARETLARLLPRLPRDARTVLFCGAEPVTLLLPGEEAALALARLEDRVAEAAPPTIPAVLEALARVSSVRQRCALVIGASPLEPERLALLPPDLEVRRVGAPPPPRAAPALAVLGAAPAASGAWGAVDVRVELAGERAESLALEARLDGAPLSSAERETPVPGRLVFVLRDLPAEGGLFEVRAPDGRRAALRLPARAPIAVRVAEDVPAPVRLALELDPAVALGGGGRPDVLVRRASSPDEDALAGTPALLFVPASAQKEAILVTHERDLDSERVLARALGELALARLDAGHLASEVGQPVAVGARPGPGRSIAVWSELAEREGEGLAASRALPLLVARAVRWLAGARSVLPFAAAGEPLPRPEALPLAAGTAWSRPDGTRHDPLDERAVPVRAGEWIAPDGTPVAVSLLTAFPSRSGQREEVLAPEEIDAAPGGWRLSTWAGLLALALLASEWVLYRRGRIP